MQIMFEQDQLLTLLDTIWQDGYTSARREQKEEAKGDRFEKLEIDSKTELNDLGII
jgi:hypothetical protein